MIRTQLIPLNVRNVCCRWGACKTPKGRIKFSLTQIHREFNGVWKAGLHCLLQTIKKTWNCSCHRYLSGASPSFRNIYSSGKSQGRQSLDVCFRQRGLAPFLQVHRNLGENPLFFQRKSFTVLPGPIVLLSTYCPLSFPGAQKSSWEEKDPTSVFLAYNWLIIFGGAAAGSPLPPRRGLQQRFSAVWTLLSLCLCDSNPTLRVRGEDFGFFFGTREEIWVTPPSRTGVNSNQFARLNPCIFICRGGWEGLIKWYPIMYYADQATDCTIL